MLLSIAATTNPTIILPVMDLQCHLLDFIILSLQSWMVSNGLFGFNL